MKNLYAEVIYYHMIMHCSESTHVSQKTALFFCNNFVKPSSILIIFGRRCSTFLITSVFHILYKVKSGNQLKFQQHSTSAQHVYTTIKMLHCEAPCGSGASK